MFLEIIAFFLKLTKGDKKSKKSWKKILWRKNKHDWYRNKEKKSGAFSREENHELWGIWRKQVKYMGNFERRQFCRILSICFKNWKFVKITKVLAKWWKITVALKAFYGCFFTFQQRFLRPFSLLSSHRSLVAAIHKFISRTMLGI